MSAALRRLPLVVLLASAAPALAHRLDEYLQATIVDVEPDDVRLRIQLTPGVDVAGQVLALIDRDGDGAVTPDEAAAYADVLKRDLSVKLDGRLLDLKLSAIDAPPTEEIRNGSGIFGVELSAAPGPLAAGAHRLALENRHLPGPSAYLFNAARPASDSVRITRQSRNENQSTGEIEFVVSPPASTGRSIAAGAVLAALVAVLMGLGRARKRTPLAPPPPGGA